ncbi:hypothetical protein [Spirosoma pulveris]
MKTKLVNTIALALLITVGAYAQDTTALSKKEIRQQERAERKARVKGELKNAGQSVGDAAKEVGRGAKEKAKVADEAVTKGAQKVGESVNKGLDKAENAVLSEADRLKAKRDSAKTEKARRDTL